MNKFLTILLCFLASNSFGQTIYEHDLDENKLKELKSNIRHLSKKPERWTYDTDKEYKDALQKYESKNLEKNGGGNGGGTNAGNGGDSGTEKGYESPEAKNNSEPRTNSDFKLPQLKLGPVGTVILYIILGGILAALIYFLFINSNIKKNGAAYEPLDLDEAAPADIPKTELERLLEEALNQKDYRKAVRIYYLFILKDLSERDWIQWEKQKTNMHYVLEMQSKAEAPAFSTAVTYFEFIWYGKRNISENQFKSVQPNFVQLLKALNIT